MTTTWRFTKLLAVAGAAWATMPAHAQLTHNLAPYVASPQEIIDVMLESAAVKQGDRVFDLGCGDGRIVITAAKRFGAKAVGVELNPQLARMASDTIIRLGLQNHASIVKANMFDVDVSSADVVTLYLLTKSNEMLKPKLEKELRAGARVVSHDYAVRGWKPIRVEEVTVHDRVHKIYVYEMGKK